MEYAQSKQINSFIKPIYEKKNYNIVSFIKYKLLLRELKKTTPNYLMLLEIYDFLLILRMVYMYNPSMDHCFMYPHTKDNKCGFVITHDGFKIDMTLEDFKDSDKGLICMTIIRTDGGLSGKSNSNISKFEFRDGEATLNDINDENLFINVINIIMDDLINLIKFYYKNKRRGY